MSGSPINLRLPSELLERIDAIVADHAEQAEGRARRAITRTGVIRALLLIGLDALDDDPAWLAELLDSDTMRDARGGVREGSGRPKATKPKG